MWLHEGSRCLPHSFGSELVECISSGCPEGSLQVSSVSSPLGYHSRAPSLASHVAAHGQCPGFCCQCGHGSLGRELGGEAMWSSPHCHPPLSRPFGMQSPAMITLSWAEHKVGHPVREQGLDCEYV